MYRLGGGRGHSTRTTATATASDNAPFAHLAASEDRYLPLGIHKCRRTRRAVPLEGLSALDAVRLVSALLAAAR